MGIGRTNKSTRTDGSDPSATEKDAVLTPLLSLKGDAPTFKNVNALEFVGRTFCTRRSAAEGLNIFAFLPRESCEEGFVQEKCFPRAARNEQRTRCPHRQLNTDLFRRRKHEASDNRDCDERKRTRKHSFPLLRDDPLLTHRSVLSLGAFYVTSFAVLQLPFLGALWSPF